MDIKLIASGSSGNCYRVGDGVTYLLLDCGIPMKKIVAGCDYNLSRINACLVTHDHKDHSLSVRNLNRRGIPVFGTKSMAESWMPVRSIDVSNGTAKLQIGSFDVQAFPVEHDTECLGYFMRSIHTNETLVYLTDFSKFPYKFKQVDWWMVEANYSLKILDKNVENGVNPAYANRIIGTHMSIEKLEKYFGKYQAFDAKGIILIHLSDGNADADDFKRRIERVTGVPVIVA